MRKVLKIIGIILLLIILIFIIWKITTYKEKTFNKFDFNTKHLVLNTTEISYLDTIVHAGLQNIDIDSVIIVIKPLIKINDPLISDVDIKAYIKGEGIQYIIFISKENKINSIQFLSHELIHLEQYYNKKLIIKNDVILWNNDTINIKDYNYNDRPWEKDAFYRQYDLESKMKNILY